MFFGLVNAHSILLEIVMCCLAELQVRGKLYAGYVCTCIRIHPLIAFPDADFRWSWLPMVFGSRVDGHDFVSNLKSFKKASNFARNITCPHDVSKLTPAFSISLIVHLTQPNSPWNLKAAATQQTYPTVYSQRPSTAFFFLEKAFCDSEKGRGGMGCSKQMHTQQNKHTAPLPIKSFGWLAGPPPGGGVPSSWKHSLPATHYAFFIQKNPVTVWCKSLSAVLYAGCFWEHLFSSQQLSGAVDPPHLGVKWKYSVRRAKPGWTKKRTGAKRTKLFCWWLVLMTRSDHQF